MKINHQVLLIGKYEEFLESKEKSYMKFES